MLTCEFAALKNDVLLDVHFVVERALLWKCISESNGGVHRRMLPNLSAGHSDAIHIHLISLPSWELPNATHRCLYPHMLWKSTDFSFIFFWL